MKHFLLLLVCLMVSIAQALEPPQPVAPPTSASTNAPKPQELKLTVKYEVPQTSDIAIDIKVSVGQPFIGHASRPEGGDFVVSGLLEPAQEDGYYPLLFSYVDVGTEKGRINSAGIWRTSRRLNRPSAESGVGTELDKFTIALSETEDPAPQPASTESSTVPQAVAPTK